MSTEPQPQSPARQLPEKPRRTWVFWLAGLALMLLLAAFVEGPREIARWHQADAQEKALDGDLEEAIESIDRAIEWSDELQLYLARAQYKLENEDYDGCLDDCGFVLKKTQEGPVVVAVMAHELRGRAHLELGQHQKAVDEVKAIGELRKYQSAVMRQSSYLNSLSYYRALGDIELGPAAEDATKAVELLGSEDELTKAILRASLGSQWEVPSPVLSEIVAYLEQQVSQQSTQLKQQIAEEMAADFPPSDRTAAEMSRLAEDHLEAFEQLWLLKRRQASASAIAAGDEHEPLDSESLKGALSGLPDMQQAHEILGQLAPVLDTRGFTFYKLAVSDTTEAEKRGQYQDAAQRDMDRAVMAMEALLQADRTLMARHRHRLADPRSAAVQLKQIEQSLAVIRYHRGLLWESLGESRRAAIDFARVRQLGHEPNDRLH